MLSLSFLNPMGLVSAVGVLDVPSDGDDSSSGPFPFSSHFLVGEITVDAWDDDSGLDMSDFCDHDVFSIVNSVFPRSFECVLLGLLVAVESLSVVDSGMFEVASSKSSLSLFESSQVFEL